MMIFLLVWSSFVARLSCKLSHIKVKVHGIVGERTKKNKKQNKTKKKEYDSIFVFQLDSQRIIWLPAKLSMFITNRDSNIYIVGVKGQAIQIYVYVRPRAQSEDSR